MRHGFYDDIPEREYHADRSSLSVSGAKTLLKAPAHFRWGWDHPTYSDAFDLGTAVHTMILGTGATVVRIDGDSWRTKKAQEARDEARANGDVPLLAADYRKARQMADAAYEHPAAARLLSEPDGRPEVSAYCVDKRTGVLRRGRFDWLTPTGIVDIKTCADANPDAFGRTAVNFGYDQQAAWYLDLAADLGHPAFFFHFLLIEKTPPYLVSVVELDADAIARGRDRNRRALEMYRDCREADMWPGYQPDGGRTVVSLPRWAFYERTNA